MKSPAIPALIRCRRTGRAPLCGPAHACLRVRSPDGQHQQGLVSREIGVGAAPVLAGHAGIAHIHDTSRLGVYHGYALCLHGLPEQGQCRLLFHDLPAPAGAAHQGI